MSLIHDPNHTSVSVVKACAAAIKVLDERLFSLTEHRITRSDDYALRDARSLLHSIVESNGYWIEYPTYKLRRV